MHRQIFTGLAVAISLAGLGNVPAAAQLGGDMPRPFGEPIPYDNSGRRPNPMSKLILVNPYVEPHADNTVRRPHPISELILVNPYVEPHADNTVRRPNPMPELIRVIPYVEPHVGVPRVEQFKLNRSPCDGTTGCSPIVIDDLGPKPGIPPMPTDPPRKR